MKFLHISDLHLGKRLGDISLLEDQQQVLDQIVHIAADEAVDAVLIAGDVYQNASPQSEAMAVFDDFITKLRALNLKIFIISGNHDSAQRISYFSSLLKKNDVFVSEALNGCLQQYSLKDEYGEIGIHLLPFLKPIQLRRFYPDEKIESYQDAMACILKHSPVDYEKRNILVCHQFITGAETAGSEELSLGGLDNIDAFLLDGFDYVALGHIHKPQNCGRKTVRYSGSPLKYSFSEANQHKSVTIVELKEKGDLSIKQIPLTAPHDVRLVEGMLEDIMKMPWSEDYVWITIHDELPPPDAGRTVTTVFPNRLKFSISNSKTKEDMDVSSKEELKNRTPLELFSDFYSMQNNNQRPSLKHMELLEKILSEVEAENP